MKPRSEQKRIEKQARAIVPMRSQRRPKPAFSSSVNAASITIAEATVISIQKSSE